MGIPTAIGGSDCVCTALALLQVKSPQIMPDRPPLAWKIDLFNAAGTSGGNLTFPPLSSFTA
jgi:hypothetical protein